MRGHGDASQDFLRMLLRDGGDRAEALVRALTEAALERTVHGAELEDAIRHLESPTARRVLAVWACVAELARNGIAHSRLLWHGHERAGLAGGLAGRLGGVSAQTVRRALDALEAAGALKRWQAPLATPGLVRSSAGHAYQSYWLGELPRSLQRALRSAYERAKRRSPFPPESVPRQQAVPRPTSVQPPTAPPHALSPPRWSGTAPPEIAVLVALHTR